LCAIAGVLKQLLKLSAQSQQSLVEFCALLLG
jgi:hypothetical protein